ncbi:MAG: bleomycin resistance protein [Nanoarchaeota archaeon]|nr:bleomycin resistance protein [Nanoarchaeota archaeon]
MGGNKSKPGLNLVVLRSPQPLRLRDFYQNLLETIFEEHTDHGPIHYGAELGEVYLEIYPTKEKDGSRDGIGFQVGSLEEAIARVGREFLYKAPMQSSFGRTAMLKDPDARIIHLAERNRT